jgi:hypothetical protein
MVFVSFSRSCTYARAFKSERAEAGFEGVCENLDLLVSAWCAECKNTYHSLKGLLDLVLNTAFVGLSGLLLGCHIDIVA